MMVHKCTVWFLCFSALFMTHNEATNACSKCNNRELGSETENITYGPTNDFNCNCQWTIPTSLDTDNNIAVVLLLRNVSLPMTSGDGETSDCSAKIRFPGEDTFKCKFPNNYCLAFATESTICNINKVNSSLASPHHDCGSLKPWDKLGGSSYKIKYNAANKAGKTKYFNLQYIVIDCRTYTTTPESNATQNGSVTPKTKPGENGSRSSTPAKPAANTSKISPGFIVGIVIAILLIIAIGVMVLIRYKKSRVQPDPDHSQTTDVATIETGNEHESIENVLYGSTGGSGEHDMNGLYNTIEEATGDPDPYAMAENPDNLYSVIQKGTRRKESEGQQNVEIVDEPSSMYSIVNT